MRYRLLISAAFISSIGLEASSTIFEDVLTPTSYHFISDKKSDGIEQSHTLFMSQDYTSAIEVQDDYVEFFNYDRIQTGGLLSHGIGNEGSYVQLVNEGNIFTEGFIANGIENVGSHSTIINRGIITTQWTQSFGISNDGGEGIVIDNSGKIVTFGADADAIANEKGHFAQIVNQGDIATQGEEAYGIFNASDHTQIKNSGRISSLGLHASAINHAGLSATIQNEGQLIANQAAIQSCGSDATIINSGTITSLAGEGIFTQGSHNTIVNAGAIYAQLQEAIVSQGDYVHVTNSGTIYSEQRHALHFGGYHPSLTLLQGSNIQGAIHAPRDYLAVNVDKGLNLQLTLTEESNGFGAVESSNPSIMIHDTLLVVDPVGFSMQADMLADFSDGVLSGLYHNKESFLGCTHFYKGIWTQAIGSYRDRQDQTPYQNTEGGFLIGYDGLTSSSGMWGLFAGGCFSHAKAEHKIQTSDLNFYFAGMTFQGVCYNTFLGFSFFGAGLNYESRRNVVNNLASSGIENAQVDTNGFALGSELSALYLLFNTKRGPIIGQTQLRYAGLFLGNYDEDNVSASLDIQHRQVDLITCRSILGFSCGRYPYRYFLQPYVGVAGRFQVGGNTVYTNILGQAFDFASSSPVNLFELLVGFEGGYVWGPVQLSLNAQGEFDSAQSSSIIAEAGIQYRF